MPFVAFPSEGFDWQAFAGAYVPFDLAITKDDGQTTAVPGQQVTYTLRVIHRGTDLSSIVRGARVSDVFPPALRNVTWTCSASAGSRCAAGGSGDIDDRVDVFTTGTLTYVATGTLAPGATGSLVNTATVTLPAGITDPDPSNNSATDVDAFLADLAVTLDDGVVTAVPGRQVRYTLTVANHGPSRVFGAAVVDAFPPALGDCTWSCSASRGARCSRSGEGDVRDSVDLPVGGMATYRARCDLVLEATGSLVNAATVTLPAEMADPDPANNRAVDRDTFPADLAITKSDSQTTAVPGQAVVYTVAVTNSGPGDVRGATVTDDFPPALLDVVWTCTPAGGAVCTAGSAGRAADFEPNDTIAAAQDLDLANWSLGFDPGIGDRRTNTSTELPHLTILGTGNGTVDVYSFSVTNAGDQGLFDVDFGIGGEGSFDSYLRVLNVAGQVLASNNDASRRVGQGGSTSPRDAYLGLTFSAPGRYFVEVGSCCTGPVPAAADYQLQVSIESHPVSAVGDLDDRVDVPVGGSLRYEITGTLAAGAAGTLTNIAAVAPPADTPDPDPANNSAGDTDVVAAPADLAVTLDDGLDAALPGQEVTYVLTVTNRGTAGVAGAAVADAFPAELEGCAWTCSASPGGRCTRRGTGDVDDRADLPAGASATYRATCTVSPAATGSLVNTATVAVAGAVFDPDPSNDSATDVDAFPADLVIAKDDFQQTVAAGRLVTYTISVANLGPGDAAGARVTDAFSAKLRDVFWFCSPAAGARCGGDGPLGLPTVDTEPNDTIDTAQNVDQGAWSLNPDPDVGDSTGDTSTALPHLTIPGTGDGTFDVYAFTVASPGARGIFDVDFGDSFDSYLDLFNAGGGFLASGDDSSTSAGQGGSTSGRDAYLELTFPEPGVYFVRVGSCCTGPVPNGAAYRLQVSIEGHAVGAAGFGDVRETVDLPAGSTLVFTATGRVDFAATGRLVNTATVSTRSGAPDPDATNNRATDVDTLLPPLPADLAITKDDSRTTVVPGQPVRYTLAVTNSGPGDVFGARVADAFPAELGAVRWICVGADGARCPAGFGLAHDVEPNDTPESAQGLDPESWSLGFDPNVGDASANTSTAFPHVTILGTGNGTFDDYAFTVAGAGARGIFDVDFGDSFDSYLRLWDSDGNLLASNDNSSSSNGQGGSQFFGDAFLEYVFPAPGRYVIEVGRCCVDVVPAGADYQLQISIEDHASVSPVLDDVVDLPAGSGLTYTVDATLDPAATGTLVNTATVRAPARVRDPDTSNNRATDADAVAPPADLAVTLDDGRDVAVPGGAVAYVLAVTNHGPADARGALVVDAFPPALLDCAWTCAASPGSSCTPSGRGGINDRADLRNGGTATYRATCTVSAAITGTLVNTATVTVAAEGFDPDLADNSATDTDGLPADLAITKDDGRAFASPGGTLVYTIIASNAGPGHVTGATVTDVFPAELGGVSWSCSPAGGARCTSGSAFGFTDESEPNDTVETAQDLDAATWSLRFDSDIGDFAGNNTSTTIPHATVLGSGDVTFDLYAFTVTKAGDRGIFDVDFTNGFDSHLRLFNAGGELLASNDDAFGGRDAFLEFAFESPGRYLIEVGSCCAAPVPAGAFYGLHVSIESHPVGSADIRDTVDLPAGSRVVYTAQGTVAPSAEGTLVNKATVSPPAGIPDPDPANNEATDVDTLPVRADLVLTKDDGRTTAVPGQAVTYTLTVANLGPADVAGARVVDAFPPALADCGWTCTATPGSSCPAGGAGDVDDLVDLANRGRATFVAVCTVSPSATGTLVNTATVSLPSTAFDPDLANNRATDTDAFPADVAITKDDFQPTAVPGERVTYTITVSNDGPGDVVGATVEDVFPAKLRGVSWICKAARGAVCAAASAGRVDDREPNDAPETAQDLDPEGWTLSFDPNVGDKNANTSVRIPHVTVAGTGDGTVDFFSLTVANAGDRGLFDVDFGDGDANPQSGGPFDSHLRLYDDAGILLAANDDSFITDGRAGSSSTQDPYLEHVFTAPGRYVIEVARCCVTSVPAGADYLLQVSLENHPVRNLDLHDVVDLPVAATATYTATATLDPAAAGTLVNTATVSAPGDPDPSDNTATDVDVLEPQADLSVVKSGVPGIVLSGQELLYTITVANGGPLDATGVVLTDVISAGELRGAKPAQGRCGPAGAGAFTCDLGELAAGTAATVEVRVAATAPGMLTTTAAVAAGEGDSRGGDNRAETVTRVIPLEVSLGELYGIADNRKGASTLYAIDPMTGSAAAVGPIGFDRCTAMDFDISGTLYATCRRPASGPHVLITVDPLTGAGSEVGPTGIEAAGEERVADLSLRSDGVLFAFTRPRNLGWTIDLSSGEALPEAPYEGLDCCVHGLAFGPGGRLFAASQAELRVLDPDAAATHAVAGLGTAALAVKGFSYLEAMGFRPGTALLHGVLRSDRSYLVTLDAATGKIAVIGSTAEGLKALAFRPSGEP